MRKWLALIILVIVVAEPSSRLFAAGEPQGYTPARFDGNASSSSATSANTIDLLVGRSTLLNVGAPIARVSLTVPDIADALVTSPQQLLIHGKKPGTISLFVWDKNGGIKTYEVLVRRDLSILSNQLRELFPGEQINVHGSGKDVVVSGTVSTKYVVEKAAEVAGGYVEKKDDVVNLLKIQEGVASNQVLLRVRFAEVSRSALQELGASFVADAYKSDWFGRVTTQGFPAPEWDEQGRLVFSDFLNLFVFNSKEGLGAVVRALSNKGLFQSLAEPNLVATNGKEATFIAGGEYPYPVSTPSANGVAITIMFKEFGVRLSFTPTVLSDDLIHLKLKPEVSALDFSNSVQLQGFRVPALSTRRTETEVELRDGQTFAVAGLLNNTLTSSMQKIPGIGDIPILGLLFRSKAHQKNETELVVMVTPHILKRGSSGAASGLPTLVEPYLNPPATRRPSPPAHVNSPKYPVKGTSQAPVQMSPQEHVGNKDIPLATPASADAPQPQVPMARPVTNPTAPPQQQGQTMTAPPQPTRQQPAQTQPGQTQPSMARPVTTPTQTATPQSQATRPQPVQMQPVPVQVEPAPPAPRRLTKEEQKRLEQARKEDERQREAAAKKLAEERRRADELAKKQAIVDAKRAAEEKKAAEKLAREQSERDAVAARKADDARRKQAEEDAKRNKAIADAAARLKEAQAAYQAAVQKTNAEKQKPQ